MGIRSRWLSRAFIAAILLLVTAPPAMAHSGHIHRVATGMTGMYRVSVWAEHTDLVDTVLLTISATHLEGRAVAHGVSVISQLGEVTTQVAAVQTIPGSWQAEVPTSAGGDTALTVAVEGAEGGELVFTYTPAGSSWLMKQLVGVALAHGLVVAWWLWTRMRRAFRALEPAVVPTTA